MRFTRLQESVHALLFLVLALTLVACGVVQTGGAAQAPSSAQPASPIPPTAPPTETSSAAATTLTAPTAQLTSKGGSVGDQASLIDALRAAGASVIPAESVEQPFLSVKGTRLALNGADVQVFEYADSAAAQADAAKAADVLAGRGTMMIDWVAPPHLYQAGRVIVLYVGGDEPTLKLLRGALGPPLAEQPGPAAPSSPSLVPAPSTEGLAPISDSASLSAALAKRGLEVKPGEAITQPFFDVPGQLLTVNQADLQVFEFADAVAARAAVGKIGPDGNPPTMNIAWQAPPHFYQAGQLVVLYVGDDPGIIEVLANTLGPQVAGP